MDAERADAERRVDLEQRQAVWQRMDDNLPARGIGETHVGYCYELLGDCRTLAAELRAAWEREDQRAKHDEIDKKLAKETLAWRSRSAWRTIADTWGDGYRRGLAAARAAVEAAARGGSQSQQVSYRHTIEVIDALARAQDDTQAAPAGGEGT